MFEQPYIVIFGAAVRPDGSPSGALRDRVGAAVRFGRRLLPTPIYIVTGGQGRFGPPEAEVMAELLMQRGVHPDYILPEPTGRNTLRSALAVASLLHEAKGPVYAATSAYHMPRCVLLLGLSGLDAHRSPPSIGPASSRILRRWYWRMRELPAIPIDCVLMLWHRHVKGIKAFRPPEVVDPLDGTLAAPERSVVDTSGGTSMSVFSSIMSKIFGHASAAPAAQPTPTPSAFADPGSDAAAPSAVAAGPQVDVGAVLADMAGKAGQPLNWKTSIVDLMKLVGLDSSIENRKSLATELHYPGDMGDSASMNIWLHKAVMQKLADNGGIVPADLKG